MNSMKSKKRTDSRSSGKNPGFDTGKKFTIKKPTKRPDEEQDAGPRNFDPKAFKDKYLRRGQSKDFQTDVEQEVEPTPTKISPKAFRTEPDKPILPVRGLTSGKKADSGRHHGYRKDLATDKRPGSRKHKDSDKRFDSKRKSSSGKRDEKKAHRGFGKKTQTLKAVVDKNWKGFAFLIFENKSREDLFVNPRDAEALFQGDRVEVSLDSSGHLVELQVLEHRFRQMVGRYFLDTEKRSRMGWVIYERKKAREEIPIPNPPAGVEPGDWVRVQLSFESQGRYPVIGEILEVYGEQIPPSADIPIVAAEFNLTEGHSDRAQEEAREYGTQVPEDEFQNRVDL
jgi:exoribonuclease R